MNRYCERCMIGGTILHPVMVDGQIRGWVSAQALSLGAGPFMKGIRLRRGRPAFLTGTFADYLLPTTAEVPDPVHSSHGDGRSPVHAAGVRKGVGGGQLHVDAVLHRQRGRRRARP